MDETAIPILGKQVKPKQQNSAEDAAAPAAAASRTWRSTASRAGSVDAAPDAAGIDRADHGRRQRLWQPFRWYVDQINRKMAQSWDKAQVDPRTPKGARVYLIFTIHRDGSHEPAADSTHSSGSPTLDSSCMRGVQRVDTFGQLPRTIIKVR